MPEFLITTDPTRPRQPYYQFRAIMDAVISLEIHEVLPNEILEVTFEKHAKLLRSLDKCVVSVDRPSSIPHEYGYILNL